MAFHVKIKFNFKAFLYKEVKNLRAQYRRLLTMKQGIMKDPAPHNAPSTILQKGRDHWMKDTGELAKNGFVIKASAMSFSISASKERHSGRSTYMGVPGGHIGQKPGIQRPRSEKRTYVAKDPPTYEEIFQMHNQQGYSGIFNGFPKGSGFEKRAIAEAQRQINGLAMKDQKIKLKG